MLIIQRKRWLGKAEPATVIDQRSEANLRIAMISYHTCPLATLGGKDTGGMNVYVRDLTRYLGRAGVQVDVYTRSQDEHVPHVLHDLGYGNRVVHIPAGPERPLPKRELADFLPAFAEGIQGFVENKGLRYDLIHSHYWMSGVAALRLNQSWNLPVVHMFHTLGVMKQRVARSGEEAEGVYRLDGERQVLEAADVIVAATPAELAQLQWLYQADVDKVVVIPPGVDLSRFYPIPKDEAKEFIGVPPCERMLLYVGRIEPLKGIDTLIDAVAWLRSAEEGKDIPFCLAVIGGDAEAEDGGAPVEMSRLQALCEERGLGDLVTFLGRRDQDSLPYYYSAAEAVIVPSHYESFGMVALEAMACGTPVVASQVGGLAFLVQDGVTGYTVPVDEPSLLGERLARLLSDDESRRRLGRQAVVFAQDYGWETITERVQRLYGQMVKRRQRNPNSA
ncbi:MAG: glycosyltransferase [Anaerolineales bacterium]|nr:glycosyltransferase [Anaerolineales bacterium]